MLVNIIDTFNYEAVTQSEIKLISNKEDLPFKKEGWQFNWRELYRNNPRSKFYALLTECGEIQGLLMFSLVDQEMPFMDKIEITSHNLGRKGRYRNVAGNLIAFACKLSFKLGKGNYNGYLSFISKSKLVCYYNNQYGATIAMGQRMFFSAKAGRELIRKYLLIDHFLN